MMVNEFLNMMVNIIFEQKNDLNYNQKSLKQSVPEINENYVTPNWRWCNLKNQQHFLISK